MSETALIFNRVNGSFVDGWGIRTTIFLKGCPLRCAWCCNPEGQSFAPQLRYLKEHCNGCGRCLPACPAGAISLAEGRAAVTGAAATAAANASPPAGRRPCARRGSP